MHRWGTLLLALTILFCIHTSASGAFVATTGDPVSLASLEGECLTVFDKEFSNFDLFGIAIGGAIAPTDDSVFVQGGFDATTGDVGLRFLLLLNAGTNQATNANLSFEASLLKGFEFFIEDVSIILTGASAAGSGIVNVSETVLSGPVPDGAVLASLSASKQESDGGANLTDSAEFDPVAGIFIRKDISVTGGSIAGGSGHLSEFFQFYSQIPEPAAFALLGLGFPLLLRRRRRRI